MYDLFDIFLSIVVFLSPHDVKAIQIWPYAADPNSEKRELSLTWRKDGNRWVGDNWHSKTIADGKLLDEQGKVSLVIKNHLKVTNGTNYVLTQRGWPAPMNFSMSEDKDERTIVVSDGTNAVRQIRFKLWKTEPPVEFAFCRAKNTNDLIVLQKKLLTENIHCTEIRSAPKAVSFGFSVDPKDFARARTAAAKVINDNSLSLNVEDSTNGSGYEVFENGKKVREVDF